MNPFPKLGFKAFAKAATVLTTALVVGLSSAHAFPDKPIKLVVPFAPAGGTDLIARTLAVEMAKELGQPVVVDNKPGASTIIGTDLVAKSAPDGYTLVVSSIAHAVNPSLMAKMPYSTEKDFAPVSMIVRSPNVLVVRADSPFKSLKDVIAAAKADPDKLTYASPGNGTSSHLAGALFADMAKVQIKHVAYKGSGPALTDLLGGQTDMIFATSGSVGGFIDSGKLRALAVTSAERSTAYPSVPTVSEAGVPGYATEGWYGFYAPAGTPAAVIDKLNAATRKAASSEIFKSKVVSEGMVVQTGTPAEFDAFVRAEIVRWSKIVKADVLAK
ncbi:tripartite tricarboxylate transporter substrate binding protein [Hydrogenophaga sp. D2P1]|uniref:Tripartite tricarboxylate transporter substrate binding protein n=1 Tax=Hydrogenophaga aromaticivorans TaxID=2610898 RepID=A0A7Y8L0S1_9BURK|nr:tripartite tricarboxylate transporter substrate binding protein [Hydrogenophaga aromaticivorans]NWF48676.1 tripartite tricarboxylate transporter substrate binding protein [Hydrogenophaga aromaticivorans]